MMKCLGIALALFALTGCNRGIDNKEAVRQGLMEHLAKRAGLDLKLMKMEVTSVSFRGNEADAVVTFQAKDAGPGASMEMRYTLEKKDNKWVVKGRAGGGMGMGTGSPHGGAMGQMPPATPPAGGPPGDLPAGHPKVGDQTKK